MHALFMWMWPDMNLQKNNCSLLLIWICKICPENFKSASRRLLGWVTTGRSHKRIYTLISISFNLTSVYLKEVDIELSYMSQKKIEKKQFFFMENRKWSAKINRGWLAKWIKNTENGLKKEYRIEIVAKYWFRNKRPRFQNNYPFFLCGDRVHFKWFMFQQKSVTLDTYSIYIKKKHLKITTKV